MKKFVVITMVAILVFSMAAPVFAQSVWIRAAKVLVLPVTAPLELVVTFGKSWVIEGYGPATSLLRATSNAGGRLLGDPLNLLKDGAYEVEYFEPNDLTAIIDPPKWVSLPETIAVAVALAVPGVNSNWWGGAAKGWTRAKAVMIGATAGAITDTVLKTATSEE